jgi:hypothetical protein
MRWALLAVGLTVAACRTTPDVCRSLDQRFAAAIAEGPGSCVTSADCAVVGGQVGPDYCNAAPAIGACAGTPIAKNAPGYDEANALAVDYYQTCGDEPGPFDCAPIGAQCNAQGFCEARSEGSCFPVPDAGVDGGQ